MIQTGNNREACCHAETDSTAYLTSLKDTATKQNAPLTLFVLMTNRVHSL